jgi:hypothetical protein
MLQLWRNKESLLALVKALGVLLLQRETPTKWELPQLRL